MHRIGNQAVQDELRVIGHERRFVGNTRVGEVPLQVIDVPFDGNDVFLEEPQQVLGDFAFDLSKRRIWRFRDREDAVQAFEVGLSLF